jgi:hypothetical protein
LRASEYEVGRLEIRSANETPARQEATSGLTPLALCIGAGLVLAFTPVLVWHLRTGDWVCLSDWFSLYYLRFVAQAYYHHALYIADIVVPGGATTYPWLQFVPATYVARASGTGPFAVNLIWTLLSAIGLSAGVYFVFRHFLGRHWLAAGCTILCMSDYGFAAARPLTAQLQMLVSALWLRPRALVVIPWGLLLQWRIPDPGLNLPFMFFQIVALARAREQQTRLNLWLSGLAFGLLFYVFFYCWTMAAAGLSIAFLLDRGARRVYGATLCIGGLIGLPQLLYGIHLNHLLSPEAMSRFGLFTQAPRFYDSTVPTLSLLALAATAWWIWKSSRFDLLYAWSLVGGGILLSRSRLITGICFHEYHYDWLWAPIRGALVLIVVMSIVNLRFRWRPATAAICWALVMLYFAGGVYIAAICVTRTAFGVEQVQNYVHYKTQRLAGAAEPLAPGATIAGDDEFCEVAAVAEDQWVLSGEAVPRSLVVGNDQWESRAALNAYLLGMDRAGFEKAARSDAEHWFWESPERQPQVLAAFMRKYDEVVQNPDRFIAQFGVRYVALQVGETEKPYLREGWAIFQQGPYWQIWERQKARS